MGIETLLSGAQDNGSGFPYVVSAADTVAQQTFLANATKGQNACDFSAEAGVWRNFPAAAGVVSALRLKADYTTSSNGATNCQIDSSHSRMDFDYSINDGANWSDVGIGDIPVGNSGSIDILLGTNDPTQVRVRISGIAYSVCSGGATSCDVTVNVTNIRLEATTDASELKIDKVVQVIESLTNGIAVAKAVQVIEYLGQAIEIEETLTLTDDPDGDGKTFSVLPIKYLEELLHLSDLWGTFTGFKVAILEVLSFTDTTTPLNVGVIQILTQVISKPLKFMMRLSRTLFFGGN